MKPAVPLNRHEQGVALILVLSFVLLLSGIMIAFFLRSMSERQVSGYSINQTRVDVFARAAADMVVADLQQEIVAGSKPVQTFGTGINIFPYYEPDTAKQKSEQAIVPFRIGNTNVAGAEYKNLVKRSVYNQGFFSSNSEPKRASASSTLNPSLNGRFVSPQRWNRSLLLERTDNAPPSNVADFVTDFTPLNFTSGVFNPGAVNYNSSNSAAPDWILVTSGGGNGASLGQLSKDNKAGGKDPVVGRYAYQIFDEGGLLDANVAGFPTSFDKPPTKAGGLSLVGVAGSKNNMTFADLRQIPGFDSSNGKAADMVNTFVAYRNYASLKLTGPLSQTLTTPAGLNNYPNLSSFYTATINNQSAFTQHDYDTPPSASQSDHPFTTRQDLIRFFNYGLAYADAANRANLQTALQYLGTYSRGLNQPSYIKPQSNDSQKPGFDATAPKILQNAKDNLGGTYAYGGDSIINPSFIDTRVAKVFIRNNGRTAIVGEPFVIERFDLNRLAWITYKGTSFANRNDPVVTAAKDQGIAQSLVDAGTDENIYKYFGLNWNTTSHYWVYDHNSVSRPPAGSMPKNANNTSGNIATLGSITDREPDFFELLKAAISVGSLGKHGSLPVVPAGDSGVITDGTAIQYRRDTLTDAQIFHIGANMIDQFDVDNYPTRIAFWNYWNQSDPNAVREIAGIEDLPMLYRIRAGCLRLKEATNKNEPKTPDDNRNLEKTGAMALMFYPELWNPNSGAMPKKQFVNGRIGPQDFQISVNSCDPEHYGHENDMIMARTNAEGDSAADANLPPDVIKDPILSPSMAVSDDEKTGVRVPTVHFSIPANDFDLFREPTLLMKKGLPQGTSFDVVKWNSEVGGFLKGGDLYSSVKTGDKIPDDAPARSGSTYSAAGVASNGPFAGLLMGRTPMQYWDNGLKKVDRITTKYAADKSQFAVSVRVKYKDYAGSGYVTYDEKSPSLLNHTKVDSFLIDLQAPQNDHNSTPISVSFDPRTSRFGMIQCDDYEENWSLQSPTKDDFRTLTDRSLTDFPNNTFLIQNQFGRGMPQMGNNPSDVTNTGVKGCASGWFGSPNGWSDYDYGHYLEPFLLVMNDARIRAFNTTVDSVFYADPDGVVRRAMGGYVADRVPQQLWKDGYLVAKTPATMLGNPLITGNDQSRPTILNRPFRSIGELGYVFRDMPWKNLDFFSPESGDAALLDVFCINGTVNGGQLEAGKINVNTSQKAVVQAIVAGTLKDEDNNYGVTGATAPIIGGNNSEASKIADAFLLWQKSDMASVTNVSNMISKWSGAPKKIAAEYLSQDKSGQPYGIDGVASYNGLSKQMKLDVFTNAQDASWNIQRLRESSVRGLADMGQGRVWNLMIDVIAQVGQFPASAQVSAAGLNQFVCAGEQRYWVHLAIDRLTGKVLDSQIEVVKE